MKIWLKILGFGICFLQISFGFSQSDTTSHRRVSWIQQIIFDIFPTKVDKQFKKYMKSNSTSDLRIFLNSLSEEEKQKALLKTPATYNMLWALIYEKENQPDSAYKYYSLVHSLDTSNVLTKRDIHRLGKLQDNFSKMIYDNKKQYREMFLQDSLVIENKIKEYSDEMDNLNQQLDSLGRLPNSSVKEKQLSVVLKDLKKYKTAIQELQNMRSGMRYSPEIVKVSDKGTSLDKEIETVIRGYKSGEFCNEEIKESAKKLLEIELANAKQKKNVKIVSAKIEITGHADGDCYGKEAGKYKNDAKIEGKYFVNKVGKKITLTKNSIFNNEQLAFLRAFCAYNVIKVLLASKQIDISECIFYATEHKEISDTLRGITLKITIEKCFAEHYEVMQKRVAEIDSCSERVADLQKKINLEREKKDKIRKIIEEAEGGKMISIFNRIKNLVKGSKTKK